jgi:hypothetical protein
MSFLHYLCLRQINIFKAQENIIGKETIVKFDTLDLSLGAPNKGSA